MGVWCGVVVGVNGRHMGVVWCGCGSMGVAYHIHIKANHNNYVPPFADQKRG